MVLSIMIIVQKIVNAIVPITIATESRGYKPERLPDIRSLTSVLSAASVKKAL